MRNTIDDFSQSFNGKKWTKETNPILTYEDYSGDEYMEDLAQIKLPKHILSLMDKLYQNLNINIDFIISQEIYINIILLNDIEKIKFNESLQYISTIHDNVNEVTYINPQRMVKIIQDIIAIKETIIKHINYA